MDVLLDSNVYLQDLRMTGNGFQELFTYLRRTDSSLLLPHLVREEVVGKYSTLLKDSVQRVQQAFNQLSKLSSESRQNFQPPNIEREAEALRKRLASPSRGIRVLEIDGYDQVDIKEVANRGILRKRPASPEGEELRDVILWFITLHLARTCSAPFAFISNDKAFEAADGRLHPDLIADLNSSKLQLDFYSGIKDFVIAKALERELLDAHHLEKWLPKERLEEIVLAQLLRSTTRVGKIMAVDIRELEFEQATKYKVQENAFFIEVTLHGSAAISAQPEAFTYFLTEQNALLNQPMWNTPPRQVRIANAKTNAGLTHWLSNEPNTVIVGPFFGAELNYSEGWNYPLDTVNLTPTKTKPDHYLCSFRISLTSRLTEGRIQSVELESIQFGSFLSDEPRASPPS